MLLLGCLGLLCFASNATPASVGPAGYTNAFAMQPMVGDWATFNRTGSPADVYDSDADVNASITAAGVSTPIPADSGDPPAKGTVAVWSSTGFYLQTRPTLNRYIALMGKFVNNTGTNATQVNIAYQYTIAAGGTPEDSGKGTRVYYSVTGLNNSWTNLPALNHVPTVNVSLTLSTNLALNWSNGASLFLLWVDDNSKEVGDDAANQIDNFSLQVTAGQLVVTNVSVTLNTPVNQTTFVSDSSPSATASVLNGTLPFTLVYFTNNGAGNTIFAAAGASSVAPFKVNLGSLTAGTYNIYAVVSDSSGPPGGTSSLTNTFFVVDPISLTLTDPADGAMFENPTSLLGAATISGGTGPYSVQFYLDNLANGSPETSTPFHHDFGALSSGDHTIAAIVTDAMGWVSNSLGSIIHIIDTLPPSITSIIANDPRTVVITFSEPVEPASAVNAADYLFSPALTIAGIQILNPTTIVVTTERRDAQFDYTLSVTGVRDLASPANAMAAGTPMAIQRRNRATSGGLAGIETVFVILFENEDWSAIKDNPDAPYLNSLLSQSSYCEQYHAHNNQHPSEPNYIYLEAGTNFGFTDDNGPSFDQIPSTNHLVTLLNNVAIDWRGYMESMPAGTVGTTDFGQYVGRHNPFAFFNDVVSNYNYGTNHVRPYSYFSNDLALGQIGRYNFITPNLTNDMHDLAPGSASRAQQGDTWLARELPAILNSAAFSNNGAVFLTFDENGGGSVNSIMMMVLSPLAKGGGYLSTSFYDHSSTVRTMQDIFGVRPYLGDAANAVSLSELFKNLTLTLTSSNGLTGVTLNDVVPGQRNYVQASSDLTHWATIATNNASGTVTFPDPDTSNFARRFYRVIEAP